MEETPGLRPFERSGRTIQTLLYSRSMPSRSALVRIKSFTFESGASDNGSWSSLSFFFGSAPAFMRAMAASPCPSDIAEYVLSKQIQCGGVGTCHGVKQSSHQCQWH